MGSEQLSANTPPIPNLDSPFLLDIYRNLLENFADGVAILTPDGLVLDMDQRSLACAQIRTEEAIGKPLTDFPLWSYDPVVQQQLRAAIMQANEGSTVRFEARVRPRPGAYLDMVVTVTPHLDVDRRVKYLICTGRDITERKRAEKELRVLVEAIPHFVWIMRPDGSAEYANQPWCDYTNLTAEQLQGNGWVQILHPDDRRHVLDVWQTAFRTGTLYEVVHRIQNGRTGEYRWFLARARPFRDRQGNIQYWLGTCTDIDEQKRAEQRLRESEQHWRVLAEAIPQLVWVACPDGRFEYWNQRSRDYMGVTLEQVQHDRWIHLQFLHPEDQASNQAAWQLALETGNMFELEQRLKNCQTGEYRWFLVRALPVLDERGQIVKWFGTCTDIDEQKRTEEALRQSQQRVRALIDSNIIGIISLEGEEEIVVEANDAFLRMSGYTCEEVHSRTLNRARLTAPQDRSLFDLAFQELAAHGQHTPFETDLMCKDGSRLPVLIGGVVFQDQPRLIVSFVLDNSARKELERRKDDFLSMASHELKTPLTSLKLQTQLLSRQLTKQGISCAAPALFRMEAKVKQLERLIGELLDVSRIQEGKLGSRQEIVNLDELLREVVEMMQQTSKTHTIVVRGTAPDPLIGDKDQLTQVFSNLISNAIKYAPDTPLIEVELSSSTEEVSVKVRDYGIGIPKEEHEKIFERFYRAFDPSQRAVPGLGMGLHIVAKIVKQLGGTITVESEIGKGSTFVVTLPLEKSLARSCASIVTLRESPDGQEE
jgi:PAS domain S-box-containing protein